MNLNSISTLSSVLYACFSFCVPIELQLGLATRPLLVIHSAHDVADVALATAEPRKLFRRAWSHTARRSRGRVVDMDTPMQPTKRDTGSRGGAHQNMPAESQHAVHPFILLHCGEQPDVLLMVLHSVFTRGHLATLDPACRRGLILTVHSQADTPCCVMCSLPSVISTNSKRQ